MADEDQIVWRVRYVNDGETKLRVVEVHTDTDDLTELFDELEQFNNCRILSIRNVTFKAERSTNKKR